MRNLILKVSTTALFTWMVLAHGGTAVHGSSTCPDSDCGFYRRVCNEGGGTFDIMDCEEDEESCTVCDFICAYENVWGFGACNQ